MYPEPALDTDNPCALRRQLAAKFAVCARLYAEAVVPLARDIATMSKENYQQVRASTEDAKHDMEAASLAFEEHIKAHRCLGWNDDS
jgi:hypothetical protein